MFAASREPELSVHLSAAVDSPPARDAAAWLRDQPYAVDVGSPVPFLLTGPGYAEVVDGWVSGFAPPEPAPSPLPLPSGVRPWPGDVATQPYGGEVAPARVVVPPGERALFPLRWRAMSTANDPDVTTTIGVVPVPGAEPVLLDVTRHESSQHGLDVLDGARVRVGPWVQDLGAR